MGYIFNFLWRFFIVFSRVFMLSLFATEFQHELFVFLGLHWLLMSLWIFMMVILHRVSHKRSKVNGSEVQNDQYFFELWCIAVSSTIFQKSNIDWHQQPLIKKVLKFNMIFHDFTKLEIFSKHQTELEFKNLDDSEVLSSDFPCLKTSAALMTSVASTASMTSTASFHEKHY